VPTEIERKFVVVSDAWRLVAAAGVAMRQGYLARTRRGTMRVRLAAGSGAITVKSRRRGIAREEFTYPVPAIEAEYMLARLCVGPVIEKVRHLVRHEDMTWQVDVYAGAAAGLVVAEIELQRPDQEFERPAWVGAEVTHDLRYRNSTIARAGRLAPLRLAAAGLLTAETSRTA
jgi:adenylate cyclase